MFTIKSYRDEYLEEDIVSASNTNYAGERSLVEKVALMAIADYKMLVRRGFIKNSKYTGKEFPPKGIEEFYTKDSDIHSLITWIRAYMGGWLEMAGIPLNSEKVMDSLMAWEKM